MKKITILLVLGALFVTNIYFKTHNYSIPQNVKTEETKLGDYQKNLDREKELKKLQDPTIIQSQLNKVGKITSLTGQYKYFSHIEDKDGLFKKFVLRDMTLDFSYNFGIGIDLSSIKVTKIEGTTVYLNIPRSKIQLQYIQMNPESKVSDSHKVILISQFSPSDIETVTEQSQQNVINKINSDKKIFNTAQTNLQDEIEKLIKGLGYYQEVVFNEEV